MSAAGPAAAVAAMELLSISTADSLSMRDWASVKLAEAQRSPDCAMAAFLSGELLSVRRESEPDSPDRQSLAAARQDAACDG